MTEPQRDDSQPDGPTESAGRAMLVVLGVLGLLAVLRAPAMVHTGEGMRPGLTRTLVLGGARPLVELTHPLRLDLPDRWLADLFGRAPASSPSNPGLASTARRMTPQPAHPARTVPALRVPSVADPQRVLITGDSLTETLGPAIATAAGTTVHSRTETRYGTGLVRPDFFDWAVQARAQAAQRDLELVIVTMGGNDGQTITLPDGTLLPAGTPRWAAEYTRRAEVVMRIWTGDGTRHLLWLGLPPARSKRLAGYFDQLDTATAAAARTVPGATYLDLRRWLSRDGGYSDYLTTADGRAVLARSRDGVHLTLDGARIVAGPVLEAVAAMRQPG